MFNSGDYLRGGGDWFGRFEVDLASITDSIKFYLFYCLICSILLTCGFGFKVVGPGL